MNWRRKNAGRREGPLMIETKEYNTTEPEKVKNQKVTPPENKNEEIFYIHR